MEWCATFLALVASSSALTLAVGPYIGLTYFTTDPQTHTRVLAPSGAALTAYLCLVFTIANWPLSEDASRRQ